MEQDIILKMVSVGTTTKTLEELDVNVAKYRKSVDPDKLIGQPFLSRSSLCHAIFTRFNEDPESTLKFLNISK